MGFVIMGQLVAEVVRECGFDERVADEYPSLDFVSPQRNQISVEVT